MNAEELRAVIVSAFAGCKLDGGLSLRQGGVMDDYGAGVTTAEYQALPRSEIIEDWQALPLEEMEQHPYLAHVDEKGFRYYIPAFMLSVLTSYEPSSMRVISTLASLRPKSEHRDHYLLRYSFLTPQQRTAIAVYLRELPNVVAIEPADAKNVSRALRDYWLQFLPPGHSI